MKHVRFRSRFLAVVAVCALLFAVPIGVLAHEHSDQAGSQCRICKLSGSETAVFNDGPALPAPERDAGLQVHGVQFVPAPPATAAGAPRAPPS